MRAVLYTLILSILPMLVRADHIDRILEGKWDNERHNKTIKIKTRSYGLKVKGLYKHNQWTRFYRDHRGRYSDDRGNRLILRDRHQLIFVNRHNHRRTRFLKIGSQHYYDYTAPSRGSYYQDPYYYREQPYDGYYRGNQGRSDRKYGVQRPSGTTLDAQRIDDSVLRDLEGTWIPQAYPDRKVVIVSTRDGIKAKDLQSGKWHRYRLDESRRQLIDDRGNRYIMSNRQLYWTKANSQRPISLQRLSRDTF